MLARIATGAHPLGLEQGGEDPVSYTHLDVYKRQHQGPAKAKDGPRSRGPAKSEDGSRGEALPQVGTFAWRGGSYRL